MIELAGGIVSGSLALLSDAIHNFSDGIAIILTYTAMRFSRRPRTLRYTFGFKRAEILAAIINASALILISFFLIREALGRFSDPHPIAGVVMLAVAVAGLIANVAGTLLLKRGSRENINIRAAYVHLLTDAVSSVSVIIGAVCIIVFDIAWIDPVLSILIAVYILKETYDIVKDSVDILMMSAPPDVDINDLQRAVEMIPGVMNIHHVHIWQLNDSDIHFEAHIDVSDMPVSQTVRLQRQIDDTLRAAGRITHTRSSLNVTHVPRKSWYSPETKNTDARASGSAALPIPGAFNDARGYQHVSATALQVNRKDSHGSAS